MGQYGKAQDFVRGLWRFDAVKPQEAMIEKTAAVLRPTFAPGAPFAPCLQPNRGMTERADCGPAALLPPPDSGSAYGGSTR